MAQPNNHVYTYTINEQKCVVTAVYSETGETFTDYLLRLLLAELDPAHVLAPQQ